MFFSSDDIAIWTLPLALISLRERFIVECAITSAYLWCMASLVGWSHQLYCSAPNTNWFSLMLTTYPWPEFARRSQYITAFLKPINVQNTQHLIRASNTGCAETDTKDNISPFLRTEHSVSQWTVRAWVSQQNTDPGRRYIKASGWRGSDGTLVVRSWGRRCFVVGRMGVSLSAWYINIGKKYLLLVSKYRDYSLFG